MNNYPFYPQTLFPYQGTTPWSPELACETIDNTVFVRYVGGWFCKLPLMYRLTPGVETLGDEQSVAMARSWEFKFDTLSS